MARIYLDIGHMGRTGGKVGARHGALREEDLAHTYAQHAAAILRRAGHEVQVLTSGSYSWRRKRAVDDKADIYVCCHCNAGNHNPDDAYGLVLYRKDTALAKAIAGKLKLLSEIPRVATLEANADDWTKHAHALLKGLGAVPSAVFEPGFIDSADHAGLWTGDGLERIGVALAAGILEAL